MKLLNRCVALLFLLGAATGTAHGDAAEECARREAALSEGDVAARMELARWCARNGLADRERALYEAVVAIDPAHAAAHRALGHVRFRDRWVTPEERDHLAAGEVNHADLGWVPRADAERWDRGLRPFENQWLPPERIAALRKQWDHAWEHRSDHYVVRTTVSEEYALECAERLEGLRRAVMRIFGERLALPEGPLEVWIFDRPADFARVATRDPPRGYPPGFYTSDDRRAYFLYEDPATLAARDESSNEEILLHECTHQILNLSIPMEAAPTARPDFWVMEGIALLFETLRWEGDEPIVGGAPGHLWARRAKYWGGQGWLEPLDRFVRMDQTDFSQARTFEHYAQAAALAEFLLNGREGSHREEFLDYCVHVHRGRGSEGTFERILGASPRETEEAWRAHLSGG